MAKISNKGLFLKFRDTARLDRVKKYAEWTLPYLSNDTFETVTGNQAYLRRDYQSVGALLVNNLSAKLAQVLFPTQFPFFQADATKEMVQASNLSKKDMEEALVQLAIESHRRLFVNAGYASLIYALKHLMVIGDVLIYRDSDAGTITAYGCQNYATRRDGRGTLLECILREFTVVEALPEEVAIELRKKNKSMYSRPEQRVEKYTRIKRGRKNSVEGYFITEEVDDCPVGSEGWYPLSLCPWMVPTWTLVPGEHNGRGLVEDHAGSFATLSALSESASLYGVEMMRILHLVANGAGPEIDEIAEAEHGEFIRGDPGMIAVHEAGDANKLQAVVAEIERAVRTLAQAFMYQGVTRDAERVTAYELQRDAHEAEFTLGGVYSTLTGSMQIPFAHILMSEVSEGAELGIILGELSPDITAGIPALGRAADIQNLMIAMQELSAIVPIAELDRRINPERLVDVVFKARAVDPKSIFYTPEEQQRQDEAAQAEAQAQQSLIEAQALAQSAEQIQNL